MNRYIAGRSSSNYRERIRIITVLVAMAALAITGAGRFDDHDSALFLFAKRSMYPRGDRL